MLLGIHTSTVKRWFREVAGAQAAQTVEHPAVVTTSGGHRRIPLDVALGVARQRGHRVGLHRFGAEAGRVWIANRALMGGNYAPAQDLLLEWLRMRRSVLIGRLLRHLTGVAEANRQAVDGRLMRTDPLLFDGLLTGFLKRAGDCWACGELRISDERAAAREVTETLYALLNAVEEARAARDSDVPATPRSPGSAAFPGPASLSTPHPRTAIVATLEGDPHRLGSLMARLVLAQRGWIVQDPGAGLPIVEIVDAQRRYNAAIVCLSLIPPRGAPDIRRFVEVATHLSDPRRPWALLVGGSGSQGARLPPPGGVFTHTAALDSLASLAHWLMRYEEAHPLPTPPSPPTR